MDVLDCIRIAKILCSYGSGMDGFSGLVEDFGKMLQDNVDHFDINSFRNDCYGD
ncbi:hypothetical protein LCGC14_0386470 [marine sediment metagenome]|uniref:Uncharacterized protein n=1 Tax=marine sediment metagenome TaxID=412755 RepID=A0A0F9W9X0_9ZZZZ